ncbi:hypothetical protein GCM10018987_43960 [Streptomyces cremeus]
MVAVLEAQPLAVPAGGGEFGEHTGVDGGGPAPRQQGHGERVERAHPAAQPIRQDLLQLGQGAHRGLADALDALAGRGAQADRDGDRLVVVEQQRRQPRAHAELVAAAGAGAGVDGVAEFAEPVDVAPHGARGDAEALRQAGSGPFAVGLEQREQTQQPGRGLQHAVESARVRGQVRSAMPRRTASRWFRGC